jgi:hypothetical protein
MRRLLFVLISAVAGIMLTATSALASPGGGGNPHFQFADNSVNTAGTLTTSFKEVGLGTGISSVTITLNADASALYQCFNNGGNHPKAGNKETVSAHLQTSGSFPVSNGNATGSLSVGPPSPGGFTCPSGQTLFLQTVTYSNTILSDEGGHSIDASPDPISSGTLHTPVP